MDGSLLNSFIISYHSLHSMAFNPVQICGKQNILDDIRLFFIKTKFTKYVVAKSI